MTERQSVLSPVTESPLSPVSSKGSNQVSRLHFPILGFCCSSVSLCLLIMVIILLGRLSGGSGADIPAIASDLLPGGPMAPASDCQIVDPEHFHLLYCTRSGDDPAAFEFDTDLQKIRYASCQPKETTIGDLIVAWGVPDSYSRSPKLVQVYWGNRSALLQGSFAPTTTVQW